MELQPLNTQGEGSSPYFPLVSSSSLSSIIFFSWAKQIFSIGKKNKLTPEDVYPLPDEHSSQNETLTSYLSRYSLYKSLLFSNIKLISKAIMLGNLVSLFDFSSPLFIQFLLSYLQTQEKFLSIGILLAISFTIVTLTTQVLKGQFLWTNQLVEIKIKSSLSNAIFCKVLKVARIPEGTGVNILQVDVKKVCDGFKDLSLFISTPLQAGLSMYLIYYQVGNAVYAALATLTICLSLNTVITRAVGKFSGRIMSVRDRRVEATTQMLASIKMIKAYVWEKFFKKKIEDARVRELSLLRKLQILQGTTYFFFWIVPSITAAAVFMYYTLVMEKSLDPGTAFVTLSTLLILQDSLQEIPWLVSEVMMCIVSCRRMQGLIDLPDLEGLPSSDTVDLKECTLAYGDKSVLNRISLKVNKGEFIAVVGTVGSGKSSLLNGIMGELKVKEGVIKVTDSIAYAPSLDSWLQNDSLRNNILFGKPYNEAWYLKVVDACCLIQDINSLPNKDLTEIGERGINLSGGQKARICLARAVYADKDIYLLDDPLSSVDTFVATHIMNKCFLNVLSQKTRILVTHRLNILNKVDRVIVLQNGSIIENSSPDSLQITQDIEDHKSSEIEEMHSTHTKLIEDEDKESGKVNIKILKDYFGYSGGYLMISIAFLAMGLWAATRMIADIILKEWSTDPDGTETYLLLYILFRVGGTIFAFIRAVLTMAVVGNRASRFIHNQMIKSFIRAPVNLFYDVTPLGRILNRLNKDLNSIDELVPRATASIIAQIWQVLSMVFLALIYFPILIMILPFWVYYSLQIKDLYLGAARELTRLEAISNSPILNNFEETLSGAKIIRTFRQTQNFHIKNCRLIDINSRLLYSMSACRCWLVVNLGLLSSGVLCFMFALIVVFRNNISLGAVGLSLAYVVPLPINIYYLVIDWANLENQLISVERAKVYMGITSENPHKQATDKNLGNWPQFPSIEFKNVQMKYRSNTPIILKGVNFSIEAGKRVGLVGRTGSGKSSIYLCLLRLVEISSGSILIDGVNIAMIGLNKLRSAITLVPQDPLVFSGDLKDNLDPCQLKSNGEVENALKEVNLTRFSIDYEIKGDGSNISAGERQLISLGRAMLTHTKIILFDEATAGIDQNTDHQIQELIKNKFQGCTILTIAHRLGTVMESDQIIVMQDGKVSEAGNPKVLLSKDSIFKSLKDNFN
ncbi:unnamed protein product [Blepharisma stoltei]|uniref:Uncharacterized protein n=1 Tax=Blepharisma stoltei TaxID=1481888 RepID=A0AAU9JND9_9CILI|nr:unnamed protein product [Blepharisma stoltei]